MVDWSGVISDDRPPVYEANMMLWDVRGIARINRDAFLVESRSSAAHFLREVHGVVDSEDLIFQEYSAAFKKVRESGYPPIVYPDAKSTLEKLINNGYWVEVISAHPIEHILEEAKIFGIDTSYLDIHGSVKNKAQAIYESADNMRIPLPRVAYIGDTKFDIQAAKQAGCVSVGVSTGYHAREVLDAEKPDHLFDSLTDLTKAVLGS